MTARTAPGRPRTTSRDEIQRIALQLFATQGFDETTLDDVASAVGVSRRTLFRYYPSKNDLVWGEFSKHLRGLREQLAGAAPDDAIMDVLCRALVAFNDYGDDELPELRIRLSLITSVPTLQGHSMLRYREWCDVIAEFVAARLGCEVDDHRPQVVAHAALGTAMATYRHWIRHRDVNLLEELGHAFRLLASGFDERLLRQAGS